MASATVAGRPPAVLPRASSRALSCACHHVNTCSPSASSWSSASPKAFVQCPPCPSATLDDPPARARAAAISNRDTGHNRGEVVRLLADGKLEPCGACLKAGGAWAAGHVILSGGVPESVLTMGVRLGETP